MNGLCGLFNVQFFRQIGYLERKVRFERGEGWTGGRGPTPKWVKDVKDAGGDIEKYRVKP